MSYSRDDYWQEAFEIAMEDADCGHLLSQMTKEQREDVGGALCGAAENEGQAFHAPENPMIERNNLLERQLKWERDLWPCETCKGRGRIITPGPYHSSDSPCWKCHGEGKYHPLKEARPA